jgi:hypothetical protein
MIKTIRFIAGLGTTAVIIWLAILVSPRHAGADVFTTVKKERSLANETDSYPHPGGERAIEINGVKVKANLFVAKHNPAEAIRRIAAGYSDRHLADFDDSDPYAGLDAAMRLAAEEFNNGDLEMAAVADLVGYRTEMMVHVDNVVASLVAAIERPLFSVGKDWAAFGRFPASTLTRKSASEEAEWRRHSYKGLGFLVLATRHQSSESSILWHLEFPEKFRLEQLLAKPGDDARGSDIEEIARYPGSRRIGSISEEAAFGKFRLAGFSGNGSPLAHADHYKNVLQAAGYVATPHQSERDGSILIVANKGTSEVSVFVTESTDRQGIVDIVQIRTKI